MPEEMWTEVCNTEQESVIKTITKKKNHKKVKWLSEEALKIAGKSREEKNREKTKDIQVNAEFQRITGRDKKAFLSDQCKEIDENNRIGKTREN